MDNAKMTISNGIVYVGENGTVSNVDFNACHITVGRGSKFVECTIDDRSEIEFNG